jgi:hypothetical protein
MAIDDSPNQEFSSISPPSGGHDTKFVIVFVILAALAVGEIFTLSKVSSMRTSLEGQQTKTRADLSSQFTEQISSSMNDLEHNNTKQFDAMRSEIEDASKRVKVTNSQVHKAKTMLTELQKEQKEQAETVQQQISQKADAQQLIPLTQEVSSTRTDLDGTKKSVDSLRSDLGMARSELGTLIARNHDEIGVLRKLGERDYIEFTLTRNKPQRVANMDLNLKKTNIHQHRFNLVVTADDLTTMKKNRIINEPIFLYVKGTKKPYEIVVNSVQSNEVKGYISIPKSVTEVAETSKSGK